MSEFEPKHFEMLVKDQIALIRLNRPDRKKTADVRERR